MDFSRFKEDDETFLTGRGHHAQIVRIALILVLLGGGFLAASRILQWSNGSETRSLMILFTEIMGWISLVFSTVVLFPQARRQSRHRLIDYSITVSGKKRPHVFRILPEGATENTSAEREDAIDKLYSELRPLLSRAAADPSLREEAQRKLSLLRKLQDEEADEIQKRFEAGLLFKPGEGRRVLERAREILARYEDPSSPHAATRQKN